MNAVAYADLREFLACCAAREEFAPVHTPGEDDPAVREALRTFMRRRGG